MESKNDILNQNNQKILLGNIKSNRIVRQIFNNLLKKNCFRIIKYNKSFQNKLNLDINDYKKYSKIVIEIIPLENQIGPFIIIPKEEEQVYFHIYFDDNKNEIKQYSLNESQKIKKIKIIIDNEIKSLSKLFEYCNCIKTIEFKRFFRNNINDMNHMFSGCFTLKRIFFSQFNTNNVTDMSYMFYGCTSLDELNLSNFNTTNVINMSHMFDQCSSLVKLNINHFNINNVKYMTHMFSWCNSLQNINLFRFEKNKSINVSWMFNGCSYELKKKIRKQNKNIGKSAFT